MKRVLVVLLTLTLAMSFAAGSTTLADNRGGTRSPTAETGLDAGKGTPEATPYEVYQAIHKGTVRGPVILQDTVKYFAGIQTMPQVQYSGFRVAIRGGDVASEPGKPVYLTPHLVLHFVRDYIAFVALDEGVPGSLRLKTFQETVGWEDEGIDLLKSDWYEFKAVIDRQPDEVFGYELSYRWLPPPPQQPGDFISLRTGPIADGRAYVQFFLEHTVPTGQKATEHGKSNWDKMQLRNMQYNWMPWIEKGDTAPVRDWPPLREEHNAGAESWVMDTWSTYYHAETSITQGLENPGNRGSVVLAPVNIDSVKDPVTGEEVQIELTSYRAQLNYTPAFPPASRDGIQILEVRGVAPLALPLLSTIPSSAILRGLKTRRTAPGSPILLRQWPISSSVCRAAPRTHTT